MTQIDPYELYGTRLLVFLEEEPQSNKYRQILLTKDEFKKLSLSIGTVVEQDGADQTVEMHMSEDLYTLPDLPEHE
jgi:hypothetical protein